MAWLPQKPTGGQEKIREESEGARTRLEPKNRSRVPPACRRGRHLAAWTRFMRIYATALGERGRLARRFRRPAENTPAARRGPVLVEGEARGASRRDADWSNRDGSPSPISTASLGNAGGNLCKAHRKPERGALLRLNCRKSRRAMLCAPRSTTFRKGLRRHAAIGIVAYWSRAAATTKERNPMPSAP